MWWEKREHRPNLETCLYHVWLEAGGYNYETSLSTLLTEKLPDQYSLAVKLMWKNSCPVHSLLLCWKLQFALPSVQFEDCSEVSVKWLKPLLPPNSAVLTHYFQSPLLKYDLTLCWIDAKEGCKKGEVLQVDFVIAENVQSISLKERRQC